MTLKNIKDFVKKINVNLLVGILLSASICVLMLQNAAIEHRKVTENNYIIAISGIEKRLTNARFIKNENQIYEFKIINESIEIVGDLVEASVYIQDISKPAESLTAEDIILFRVGVAAVVKDGVFSPRAFETYLVSSTANFFYRDELPGEQTVFSEAAQQNSEISLVPGDTWSIKLTGLKDERVYKLEGVYVADGYKINKSGFEEGTEDSNTVE